MGVALRRVARLRGVVLQFLSQQTIIFHRLGSPPVGFSRSGAFGVEEDLVRTVEKVSGSGEGKEER